MIQISDIVDVWTGSFSLIHDGMSSPAAGKGHIHPEGFIGVPKRKPIGKRCARPLADGHQVKLIHLTIWFVHVIRFSLHRISGSGYIFIHQHTNRWLVVEKGHTRVFGQVGIHLFLTLEKAFGSKPIINFVPIFAPVGWTSFLPGISILPFTVLLFPDDDIVPPGKVAFDDKIGHIRNTTSIAQLHICTPGIGNTTVDFGNTGPFRPHDVCERDTCHFKNIPGVFIIPVYRKIKAIIQKLGIDTNVITTGFFPTYAFRNKTIS
ncbi:MAG: hypothetical protein BWY72_00577 [Bacteroidetes bacterium ADurb.Bin416]|nr:MAG: hypothetical protein BWY72_00577 [Bacteroidetes bacterium ADurb.Bin416]